MTVAGATPEPQLKRPPLERARFPLVWKLFGMTAILILIVVAIAVGITIQRADTIAEKTVNTSISNAARLFREFEKQRSGRLALPAFLLGHDPTFSAYIQNALSGAPGTEGAAPAIDLVSIADQLEQRRQALGTDLIILLDDQGRVVTRTDQQTLNAASREDLYEESPVVKKIVDDASVDFTAGVLPLGNRLYQAAVAPIGAGASNVRVGYLVNAYTIDDAFANRIADATNAGVIFVSPKSLSRSTNAPAFTMQQMTGVDRILKTGKAVPPAQLQVERNRYIMTGEPLTSGDQTVGAAVFVRSLDSELMPFRQIEESLLIGGGAALLLAFVLSWFIAKRVTKPIEQLAVVAQAVTAGDYEQHPNIDRSDEVGILGRSFAKMIVALRDKAELEELYEQMSAKSKEREAAAAAAASKPVEPPTLDEGTVVVTDLRGLPPVGEGDPALLVGAVTRVMRLQEAEVARQDGEVREIEGHRLVSVFRGERGVLHAIRAARAINEELATLSDVNMSVSVGIATGQFVTGSVSVDGEDGLAILGNAPMLASVLAWHAPNGHAYISYETAQTAGGEILSGSSREQIQLKWLPQPLPVASMPLLSMTTGVMRSIGSPTMGTATMRMEATQAGVTAPGGAIAELQPGYVFANRYRIEQILGRGGMGIVYKANDTQLDEPVAIKTLPGDVMTRSPEELERFKREIRLARKITHRNVLRTYDYGEAEGVYFISMECVRGYTLSELLDEAPNHRLAPRVALGIARQICRGLQAAHEQGIIHRDIKPQNVLIDHKGEVKLMDFGIARVAEAKEGMTQAGLIVGTPHYMSPEQVQGKQLDPRSDVYSMGVLMYEMLVGVKPFSAPSLTAVLTAHVMETPKPPIEQRPEIGREVNGIVVRCLAKNPKDRYTDAGALLHDLDQVQLAAQAAA
ncbi:MAG TPA: protein kinase [Thermoanaerobaculia bacterium]|nr:protein kinase [Thermoanaerobaculia bacterium]